MIYRKLIKFGNSSHVISLPNDWVKKNKLSKGSVVFVDNDSSDNLVVSPKENYRKEETNIVLKIDGKNIGRIQREIYSSYMNGYDEIIISGEGFSKFSDDIIWMINNLIGIEIMESTNSKLIAQDLLDMGQVSISNIITKIGLTTQSLLQDSANCKKKEDVEELFQRDRNVNRLNYFANRVLNKSIDDPSLAKQLGINSRDIYRNSNFVNYVEGIADYAKWMGKTILSMGKNWSNYESEFLALFDMVLEYYNDALKAYNKSDWKSAVEIADRHTSIIDRADSLLKKYRDPEFRGAIEKLKYIIATTKSVIRLVY